MEKTYQFDFTHEELSYLLELLHNEQYTGNTNAALASSLSGTIHMGVMVDHLLDAVSDEEIEARESQTRRERETRVK